MNPVASPTQPSLVTAQPRATKPISIAVVIAGRDAADHVGEMLESLAAQTRLPDEIVFFDDGSQDETCTIVEGFLNRLPMLKVVGSETSLGISAARNRAAEHVTADFIAVLDADDLLTPEALAHYERMLECHPDSDLVYGDSFVFTGTLQQGVTMHYPTFANREQAMRKVLAAPLLPLKHSSILMRRRALEQLGGYDESFPIKVDIELFLRFLDAGKKVRKLNQTISQHRKHARQISTKRVAGIRAYRRLFRRYEPNLFLRLPLFLTRASAELMKCLVRG